MSLARNAAALRTAAAKRKPAPAPKSASKKEKEEEAPQVDLLQTGRDAMTLAGEAYPYFLDLNRKYGADYARNEVDVAEARSVAEQGTIERQGLGLREKLLGASPEIATANTSVLDRLKETGPSAIESELKDQALRELKLEGSLSPDELRQVMQGSRAASSARGLGNTSGAAIAEVMSRAGAAEARKAGRRTFASAIDGQVTQRRATDASTSNNAFNTLGSFWDPQQRLFGKGGSQVTGQTAGPSQYNNYLGAAVDVAQGNQTAQTDANRLKQDAYQFGVTRDDSYYFSEQNLQNTNANAAAQRKSSTTNAALGAGAGILAYAALAFL